MSNVQHILTINGFTESKFKEKGSVFIGQSFPVKNEDEAAAILTDIKKKYYDATHHCFAYRFVDGTFKYSDDGEPSGTAGIRIINAIDHFNLTDVLVVSIRYYGGTKLGVGPLGKAYYKSAYDSLSTSEIIKKKPYLNVSIISDFQNMSHVHRILSNFDTKINDQLFGENVEFKCLVAPGDVDTIERQLTEITKGEVKINADNVIIFI